jgi:hypothetical protein
LEAPNKSEASWGTSQLISYTKSGLAIPVITQSAQADFVCIAAISIALAKGGNKSGFGIIPLSVSLDTRQELKFLAYS